MSNILHPTANLVQICHRILSYDCIINLCLRSFHTDNVQFLLNEDVLHMQKIEEGENQLRAILQEIDNDIFNNRLTEDHLSKFRHDLRLAINIMQGYSEVILENVAENFKNMGGNFKIIIVATQEILKNIDLLTAPSD